MNKLILVLMLCTTFSVQAKFTIQTYNHTGTNPELKAIFDPVNYASAIISVKDSKGNEYINGPIQVLGNEMYNDHGREYQTAVSYNGLGECLNPTEAGSQNVPKGKQVTSKLWHSTLVRLAPKVKSSIYNQVHTSSQMGYWLNPKAQYPSGCGGTTRYSAVNTELRSQTFLDKITTIEDNVIYQHITFTPNEDYESATFEAATIYAHWHLHTPHVFDPVTNKEYEAPKSSGEQKYPPILCSFDSKRCVGLYSPDLPELYGPDLVGYGVFIGDGLDSDFYNKINCVFRVKNPGRNPRSFDCHGIFGTLPQVKATMIKLSKKKGNNE
jgi:hypothetical protein